MCTTSWPRILYSRLRKGWTNFSVVREEYATPFKCHMGELRFEVLDDEAVGARRHYDILVLDPSWMERAPVEALQKDDFEVFRRDIRDKAQ